MRTTDEILTDLQHRLFRRGEDGRRIEQQILAHQSLARYTAERAELVAAGQDTAAVDEHLAFWGRQVDEQPGGPVLEVEPAAVEPVVPARRRRG